MSLTTKQNQHLRGLAHRLSPVVIIGNAGLTEAVMEEIKLAMDHHELIKIKINADDRDSRKTLCQNIITECQCQHVQSIGHVAVFYKTSPEKKITIPR